MSRRNFDRGKIQEINALENKLQKLEDSDMTDSKEYEQYMDRLSKLIKETGYAENFPDDID